ncbi:hypothetical protein M231_00930 [Tremella mesenterica]|uniref:YCII-related domain-containing protein n=1 Tax=Tremella mesenterica TaxID=5217 RepID=A0A4Q1BUF7_TREME|nr:uncharacterized protein TREMEDRAFT_29831 [Tremella mesenterica DSM 1558]EIW69896.1 hypothetical protein TREMEDRAFT_29831 [Tremella mesenterica DSM 1558]RXK41695.1 hypothetical protein M231_00930 [Tremella mesenterica]
MPRFLCVCPDHPDILDKRLAVRPQHLVRAKPDLENGTQVYAGAILPKPDTEARTRPLPEGVPRIAGSLMVYIFPTLEDCWARVKEDVYWKHDIWDKSKIIVEELID